MGISKIGSGTTSLIVVCFFVILIVFLSSSPAVFGRKLSSSPTGPSGNSKIGVNPGHSSTAPSATGQSSPTQVSGSGIGYRGFTRSEPICKSPGRYAECLPTYNPPTRKPYSNSTRG